MHMYASSACDLSLFMVRCLHKSFAKVRLLRPRNARVCALARYSHTCRDSAGIQGAHPYRLPAFGGCFCRKENFLSQSVQELVTSMSLRFCALLIGTLATRLSWHLCGLTPALVAMSALTEACLVQSEEKGLLITYDFVRPPCRVPRVLCPCVSQGEPEIAFKENVIRVEGGGLSHTIHDTPQAMQPRAIRNTRQATGTRIPRSCRETPL